MKKKRVKKKKRSRSLAGLLPIFALSHDTVHCIVTQGAGVCRRVATTRPGGLTTRPHDMAGRAQGRAAARARGLASRGVAIQMLYRGWGRLLGRDTARDTTDDTAACTLRHDA